MANDARLAELRGLMAEALRWAPDDLHRMVDALLPVVSAWAEQHAARRAAEELRDAANEWFYLTERPGPVQRFLRARAAALTPATEEKR